MMYKSKLQESENEAQVMSQKFNQTCQSMQDHHQQELQEQEQ
jgi:hypothetical protein